MATRNRIIKFTSLVSATILLTECQDRSHTLPVLETSNVMEITETSARSGGNITSIGSGEIMARGVCWNTISNPTLNDQKTFDGKGPGSFESFITNLQPGTTYYLKAYATNSEGTSFGSERNFSTTSTSNKKQIIADHSIVDRYDDIPAYYLAEAKKLMTYFPGESHSRAYRDGMTLLQASYPAYAVNISEAEAPTSSHVRVNYPSGDWIGEATWFTWYAYPVGSRPGESTTLKNMISSYNSAGHPMNVVGFAWCSDMQYAEFSSNISTTTDPVYGCHWFGASVGGPQGDRCWGLDAGDNSNTSNNVSLQTYFDAMQDYITYCTANSPTTKIVFTTGPVDTDGWWEGEWGYQGYIKHEAIRNYVKADSSRILFDYADILCYDDDGNPATQVWNGHTFPSITTTNRGTGSLGHISNAGAIRFAKAQWWMLARIAGWDGN